MAMTAQERVAKQRQIRKAEGWHEVKVWVPTSVDADTIRMKAAEMRDEFEMEQRRKPVGEVKSSIEDTHTYDVDDARWYPNKSKPDLGKATPVGEVKKQQRGKKLEKFYTEDQMRAAMIAGWNACRSALYAVTEDLEKSAEETNSRMQTTNDKQIYKNNSAHFTRGTTATCKSIARAFSSFEAVDEDRFIAAVKEHITP